MRAHTRPLFYAKSAAVHTTHTHTHTRINISSSALAAAAAVDVLNWKRNGICPVVCARCECLSVCGCVWAHLLTYTTTPSTWRGIKVDDACTHSTQRKVDSPLCEDERCAISNLSIRPGWVVRRNKRLDRPHSLSEHSVCKCKSVCVCAFNSRRRTSVLIKSRRFYSSCA